MYREQHEHLSVATQPDVDDLQELPDYNADTHTHTQRTIYFSSCVEQRTPDYQKCLQIS